MAAAVQRYSGALAIFVIALGLNLVLGSRGEMRPYEVLRAGLASRLEAVVLRVADVGVGELFSAETRQACLAVPSESVFAALLAAWAKLSLGRVGILNELASVRLPWLLLMAIAPALLFTAIKLRGSRRAAAYVALAALIALAGGNAILPAHPAFMTPCTWVIIGVPYWASLCEERAQRRNCAAFITALAAGIAASLSWSALWALPLMAAHYTWYRRDVTRRVMKACYVPAPLAFVLCVALVPLILIVLNPAHWGVSATVIVGAWLSALG